MADVIRLEIGNDNEVDFEQLRAARAGLNRTDHDTVALQLNDHRFAMTFSDFLNLIETMARDAGEFARLKQQSATPDGVPS